MVKLSMAKVGPRTSAHRILAFLVAITLVPRWASTWKGRFPRILEGDILRNLPNVWEKEEAELQLQ